MDSVVLLMANMELEASAAVPAVIETLRMATSQSTELFRPAEDQLRKWETERGFYSILLVIVSNRQVDLNVRWQAVIYFKNGIDRYWRKTAPNAITDEEKVHLRQRLILNFSEPVNQIALQLAVVIAKVARLDYPREWPELMPTILAATRMEDEVTQHRSLLILHHVIKSLSSKRLAGDRRVFQELTSNIFPYILNLWNNHTDVFLRGEGNLATVLGKALLALKVLRKLVVHGMKEPDKVQDAVVFLHSVFQRLKTVCECRSQVDGDNQLRNLCEKYVILCTKVLLDVLENHPYSYIQFIKPSLELAVSYVFTQREGECKVFERCVIQCMKLIKCIVSCVEYKPVRPDSGVTKNTATVTAEGLQQEFFTESILIEITHRLVSQYFLLTETELNEWEDDPEGYATTEGGESWKYTLRPCTEVLFLSLLHVNQQTLVPVLMEMIKTSTLPCEPDDLQMILRKDAMYNAVGLAAFYLYDAVDFDQWFLNVLRKELEIKAPRYKIIRRSVVWLLGQWVGVKMSPELRPTLYQTVLSLLSSEEDVVVRLAAANALKVAVDDFEFDTEQFVPFLELSMKLLLQLLQQVNEADLKMQVLYVMSFVIERVGEEIRPFSDSLVQCISVMWQEFADHCMLRCAILSTLTHLVEGLGAGSAMLYVFLAPVIKFSTDVNQPPSVYLLEDGLELWYATLENAPAMHDNLLQLYPNVVPLLDTVSESLKIGLHIIQAYVVLGSREFLMLLAPKVVVACCRLMDDVKGEAKALIMETIEIIFKVLPVEGPASFRQILPHVLRTAVEGQEYPMVLSVYWCVLARVLLNNVGCFHGILELVSKDTGKTVESLLGTFLDVLLDKMSLVTQIEKQKLLGLALASMLTWPTSVVTDRFCGILLGVIEVLNDVSKTDDTGTQHDSLLLTHHDYREDNQDNAHQLRLRKLKFCDPVHTVSLKEFLKSQLSQLQQNLGSASFQQLMDTVDAETSQQLKDHLNA